MNCYVPTPDELIEYNRRHAERVAETVEMCIEALKPNFVRGRPRTIPLPDRPCNDEIVSDVINLFSPKGWLVDSIKVGDFHYLVINS